MTRGLSTPLSITVKVPLSETKGLNSSVNTDPICLKTEMAELLKKKKEIRLNTPHKSTSSHHTNTTQLFLLHSMMQVSFTAEPQVSSASVMSHCTISKYVQMM